MRRFKLLLTFLLVSLLCKSQITFQLSGGSYDLMTNVIISPDAKWAKSYVNANLDSSITEEDFNVSGCVFYIKGEYPILYLAKRPSNLYDNSIVSHEIFHLVVAYMDWAGIPLDKSSEEAYGHMVQYLTKQFYTKLNKIK